MLHVLVTAIHVRGGGGVIQCILNNPIMLGANSLLCVHYLALEINFVNKIRVGHQWVVLVTLNDPTSRLDYMYMEVAFTP